MADELQELLDRQAITDLFVAFTRSIDEKEWDTFVTFFTPDVVADYSQSAAAHGLEFAPMSGPDTMVGGAKQTFTPLRTQHYVGNPSFAIDGDAAHFECHVMALHTDVESGDTFLQSGRYVDELVRTQQGWRIAHHIHTELYTQGDPAVLIGPMTGA